MTRNDNPKELVKKVAKWVDEYTKIKIASA